MFKNRFKIPEKTTENIQEEATVHEGYCRPSCHGADHRQRLMQLPRHSSPFAISEPIQESPAHPSQFVIRLPSLQAAV